MDIFMSRHIPAEDWYTVPLIYVLYVRKILIIFLDDSYIFFVWLVFFCFCLLLGILSFLVAAIAESFFLHCTFKLVICTSFLNMITLYLYIFSSGKS